jgi:hypothetical protein
MHKECFKCKVTKPLLDFYKHPKMFDGHVNKCKECNKNDVMEHRLKHLEKLRQYDRNRGKNPDRRKANTEITKIWRSEDRRRQKAHNAVSGAIKKGILIREPCCRCNETKSLAHHEDYDRPLDVMWLCQPCHKQRHKEINAL